MLYPHNSGGFFHPKDIEKRQLIIKGVIYQMIDQNPSKFLTIFFSFRMINEAFLNASRFCPFPFDNKNGYHRYTFFGFPILIEKLAVFSLDSPRRFSFVLE
jgi:hypothetical protein